MTTFDELREAQSEYIKALATLQDVEEQAAMAESIYADELAEWERTRPDIVSRRRAAVASLEALKEKTEAAKEVLRLKLMTHYDETGQKVPFGDDHEGLIVQERLDWEYDLDDMILAVMRRGMMQAMTAAGVQLVDVDPYPSLRIHQRQARRQQGVNTSFTDIDNLLKPVIEFMKTYLKMELAKGDFRKMLTKAITKERTADGDMVIEVPQDLNWLPLDFYVKPVTVVSDGKLLAWSESQDGDE